MPACRYEFYLALVRYRVEHEKIKFVSTSGHVISAIYNYYNLEKTRVNWRDLGSRSRKKAKGKGEMLVDNFSNLGNKPLKTVQNTSDRSTWPETSNSFVEIINTKHQV